MLGERLGQEKAMVRALGLVQAQELVRVLDQGPWKLVLSYPGLELGLAV